MVADLGQPVMRSVPADRPSDRAGLNELAAALALTPRIRS